MPGLEIGRSKSFGSRTPSFGTNASAPKTASGQTQSVTDARRFMPRPLPPDRAGEAARPRAARAPSRSTTPCRRSRSTRSSSCTAATRPTTTAAIAEPPIEPRPPITTTMNAKISRLVPWFGSIVVEVDAAQHAGERRRDAADREHERERLAHVDAERRHHRAVLDAGADDQPVARPPQEELEQRRARRRPSPISTQRSFGMCAPKSVVVSCSQRGAGYGLDVRAPDALDERDERDREADGDEHLLDVALVERPDQDELDERREDARRRRARRAR